jgi:hypothetical protein
MAVDYRLRYALTLTPPERLVAYTGMYYAAWYAFRPASSGGGFLVCRPKGQPAAAPPWLARALATRLTADLTCIQPVGRWLDATHEAWLDRWCLILAAFETLRRNLSARVSPLVPAAVETLRRGTFDARTAEVDEPAVADVGQLAAIFLRQDWMWERTPAVPSSWWFNPTFNGSRDVGGADADLIKDGCLIDIKTTIDPASLNRAWVYQLLGYVLLDYSDRYGLNAIGIYLTRQGCLIRWSLAEWLPILTGQRDVSLVGLRVEFQRVLQNLREARRQARLAGAAERLRRSGYAV